MARRDTGTNFGREVLEHAGYRLSLPEGVDAYSVGGVLSGQQGAG